MSKIPIKNLSEEELFAFFAQIEEKKYRVKQLNDALYKKKINSFAEISNFSTQLIDVLEKNFFVNSLNIEKIFKSTDGSKKILYRTIDNEYIESVFLPNLANTNKEEKNTLCISTMLGCPVNCEFCATARLGFRRNLDISEIIDQLFWAFINVAHKTDNITHNIDNIDRKFNNIDRKFNNIDRKFNNIAQRIDNIVFMGMGEPFLNYDNVINALKIIFRNEIISKKNTTISTIGIPEKIIDFANEEIKIKLAVSLHSPFDDIRKTLIPISKNYQIEDLLKALDYYYQISRIPITFEYILFRDLNDRDEDIKKLARITRRFPSKINLIPFNDISFIAQDIDLVPASEEEIAIFARKLYNEDVIVLTRKSQGSDIAAACGQLASSMQPNNCT